MRVFDVIILVVGFGLLLLAASSGYCLFKNALRIPTGIGRESDSTTLWGLFLLGLSLGLLLMWWGLPNKSINL
jgi:uncharacterized BrkB/YihY/UPF0761 family membrane protein